MAIQLVFNNYLPWCYNKVQIPRNNFIQPKISLRNRSRICFFFSSGPGFLKGLIRARISKPDPQLWLYSCGRRVNTRRKHGYFPPYDQMLRQGRALGTAVLKILLWCVMRYHYSLLKIIYISLSCKKSKKNIIQTLKEESLIFMYLKFLVYSGWPLYSVQCLY